MYLPNGLRAQSERIEVVAHEANWLIGNEALTVLATDLGVRGASTAAALLGVVLSALA